MTRFAALALVVLVGTAANVHAGLYRFRLSDTLGSADLTATAGATVTADLVLREDLLGGEISLLDDAIDGLIGYSARLTAAGGSLIQSFTQSGAFDPLNEINTVTGGGTGLDTFGAVDFLDPPAAANAVAADAGFNTAFEVVLGSISFTAGPASSVTTVTVADLDPLLADTVTDVTATALDDLAGEDIDFSATVGTITVSASTAVPEPTSFALLALGLSCTLGRRRKKA